MSRRTGRERTFREASGGLVRWICHVLGAFQTGSLVGAAGKSLEDRATCDQSSRRDQRELDQPDGDEPRHSRHLDAKEKPDPNQRAEENAECEEQRTNRTHRSPFAGRRRGRSYDYTPRCFIQL